MQWGGPGFRAALSSFIPPRRSDRNPAARRLRNHCLRKDFLSAVLHRYQCRNWPILFIAKSEPQKRQGKRQAQNPAKRPREGGARHRRFWVQGTCRTCTRRRTFWAGRRRRMGWWKVSLEDVITSRLGGQGDAEAPAEAVAMIIVTGPLRTLDQCPRVSALARTAMTVRSSSNSGRSPCPKKMTMRSTEECASSRSSHRSRKTGSRRQSRRIS